MSTELPSARMRNANTMLCCKLTKGYDILSEADNNRDEARGELEQWQAGSQSGQKGRFQNVLERLLRLRQV